MRFAVGLVVVAGCAYGAGPYLGIGEHGLIAGGEAGGGFAVAQSTVGYQSRGNTLYVRADAVIDTVGYEAGDRDRGAGGIIGAGFARNFDDYTTFGVIAAGPRWVRMATPVNCDHGGTVELVTVEVRYVGEWQLVLAPRIERRATVCLFGD